MKKLAIILFAAISLAACTKEDNTNGLMEHNGVILTPRAVGAKSLVD